MQSSHNPTWTFSGSIG